MCSIAAVSGTQQNLKLFLTLDVHYGQAQGGPDIGRSYSPPAWWGAWLIGWLADRFPEEVRHAVDLPARRWRDSVPACPPCTVPAYVFAILFGIGLGGDYMIIPLLAAELFRRANAWQIVGSHLDHRWHRRRRCSLDRGPNSRSYWQLLEGVSFPDAISLLGSAAVLLLPKRAVQA